MKKTIVEKHFDAVANNYDLGKDKYSYYYTNLKKQLTTLIPPGKSVLEVGCGTGDLLVNIKPMKGYGQDISKEMINIAGDKHKDIKNIKFSTKWPEDRYDYIFMSDVIEHLEDPKEVFKKIYKLMGSNTKFINTMANPIWEPLLMLWEKMGWKMEEGKHKRIKYEKIKTIMEETGFKIINHDYKLLFSIRIPLITDFVNKFLEKSFKKFAFIEYFVAIKK